MKKTLLLFLVALLSPWLVVAQVTNKALVKTRLSYGSSDNHIEIPYEATGYEAVEPGVQLQNGTENYSVGAWIKPTSVMTATYSSNNGVLMRFGANEHFPFNNNGACWSLRVNTSGEVSITSQPFTQSCGSSALNVWHYYLVVVDNENLEVRVYIDNEKRLTQHLDYALFFASNNEPIFSFLAYGIAGQIDGAAFFNKALTDEEAEQSYDNVYTLPSLVSGYTFDEVAPGTSGQFANTVLNGTVVKDVNATYMKWTGTGNWQDPGLVYHQSSVEQTASLVEGRTIDRGTVHFDVPDYREYENLTSLTFTKVDGEEVLSGEIDLTGNTEIRIEAEAQAGYDLSAILVDGERVINGGTFMITHDMDKENIQIIATNDYFKLTVVNEAEVPYTLTTASGDPVDLDQVTAGIEMKLTLGDLEPFNFNGILMNETPVSLTWGYYSLTMPNRASTLTIDATKKALRTITIDQVEGGTITVMNGEEPLESGNTVLDGTLLTLSYKQSPGYAFVQYLVNGEGQTYATVQVKDDLTISAEFENTGNPWCDLTYLGTEGSKTKNSRGVSSIAVSDNNGSTTLNVGLSANTSGRDIYKNLNDVIFKTKAGQTLTLAVDGTGTWMHTVLYVDWNGNGFEFDDLVYTNDPTYSESRDVKTTFTTKVPDEQQPGIYHARYKLNWLEDDPCTIGQAGSDNGDVVVDFLVRVRPDSWEPRTITVAAGSGGTAEIVSPEGAADNSITTGDLEVTVKATAEEGYAFKYWTNELGEVVSTDETFVYDFGEDITLTANFGVTVTFTSTGSGTVTVTADRVRIASGDVVLTDTEMSVILVPETGWRGNLTINGAPVEVEDNVYNFTLTEQVAIEVEFEVIPKNVTLSVIAGEGTIDCWSEWWGDGEGGGTELKDGDPITEGIDELYFFFRPAENWIVDEENSDLTVDGKSDEVGKTYNFYEEIDGIYSWYLSGPFAGPVHAKAAFMADPTTGIESTVIDPNDGPVEYYNLQGVKVAVDKNLAPGVYIVRQGSKTTKVLITKK